MFIEWFAARMLFKFTNTFHCFTADHVIKQHINLKCQQIFFATPAKPLGKIKASQVVILNEDSVVGTQQKLI